MYPGRGAVLPNVIFDVPFTAVPLVGPVSGVGHGPARVDDRDILPRPIAVTQVSPGHHGHALCRSLADQAVLPAANAAMVLLVGGGGGGRLWPVVLLAVRQARR